MRMLLLLALAVPPAAAVQADSKIIQARVVSVEEGDLITIERPGQEPEQVRLYGIDAPEPEQPYFDEARAFSESKTKGLEVSVELTTTTTEGVPVVVIRTPGHENLGHELLKAGLAWWDEANAPDDGTLKAMNARAIAAGGGLWTDAAALAPWDFRKSHGAEPVVYAERVKKDDDTSGKAPVVLKAKGDPNTVSTATPAQPAPARQAAPKMEVPRDLDVMDLMTRHQPELKRDASGNVVGLTANDISQIPFASMLGFRDGDVLTSVNGTALQSEGQIMGLIQQLQGQKNLQVTVLRGGQPTTLNITLP